jgi:hypothetical protein
MKFRRAAFLILLVFFVHSILQAQETDMLDRDIDSLFDEALPEPSPAQAGSEARDSGESVNTGEGSEGGAVDMIRRRGFSLEASYFFYGGFLPGWSEAPWYPDGEFSHVVGAGINAALALDFQISPSLRVRNEFDFIFPDFDFNVKELFLDYNLRDLVFFRFGKYNHTWGISPNYPFADLLSRVPPGVNGGDPYFLRANVPVGVGGLEVLAMTRPGFITDINHPRIEEIGFGGKYDLAFSWAEIDFGVFYLRDMPVRNFISVKTTILDTEVYAEGMLSVPHDGTGGPEFSAGLGLMRGFFDDKLGINAEFFYNGEKDAAWYNPETDLEEAEIKPLVEGFNAAFNVIYRPGGLLGLRLFVQCLCAFDENSAQLVPGFSIDPFPHVNVSLAVPMALGSRDGAYYRNNADRENRPFSVVFLVSISVKYTYARYE